MANFGEAPLTHDPVSILAIASIDAAGTGIRKLMY